MAGARLSAVVGFAGLVGCAAQPVDYGGVAVLEGAAARADRAQAAISRGAAAVAIIETDVARGMGFVIDPAGYLLTNRHVIEDADHIEGVSFPARDPQRVYGSVRVVYIDPDHDLALLHVHSPQPLTAVPLATDEIAPVSDYLSHADPVVLMERQGGEGGDDDVSLQIERGEVSRLEVFNPAAGPGAFVGVTASVHQGQSGGPVLDRHGRAVGIVTWTWREKSGGFAIPIGEATRMLDQRPVLDSEASQRQRARLRTQVFIDALARSDGPAARRLASPSGAKEQREQSVDAIMAAIGEGRGLQAMQAFVVGLESVVEHVKQHQDPGLVDAGLQQAMALVVDEKFGQALRLPPAIDAGQRLSFFHELGLAYLYARIYESQDSSGALRAGFARLQTIAAARSFAIAKLAGELDGKAATVEQVELLPAAYTPGARAEVVADGVRYDVHLRLEWGDYYVASVLRRS